LDRFHSMIPDVKTTVVISRAPGRIEILGNHTDYNGGLVMASTIDQFIWSIGTTSEETTIHSVEFNQTVNFDSRDPQLLDNLHWSNYARGVFWAFRRRNHDVEGIKAVIHGNLPQGSGLSSSAALQVSLVNTISQLNRLNIHSKSKAMLAFESERLFCGLSCGVMDQFTSQLGKQDMLLGINCSNLVTQDIPMLSETSFIVINSMISRPSGVILNERKMECLRALQVLQETGWDISNLSAVTIPDLERLSESLEEKLCHRVIHIVTENHRVREGIALLKQKKINEFGKLMIESHASSRDLYEVSHPNLEILMGIAQHHDGVFGCRLTGAGLGGNLLVLAKREMTENIVSSITDAYEQESGLRAQSSICAIPGGVKIDERKHL